MAITVKELIKELQNMPQDSEVVAQVNNTGFNGMAGSVRFLQLKSMSENRPYGVWADGAGWAGSKTSDVKSVVCLF